MNSSFDRDDPQALQDFLYDLAGEAKRPEDVELLVEVLLNIQQPPSMPRPTLPPTIPIDRPATRKQGRAA